MPTPKRKPGRGPVFVQKVALPEVPFPVKGSLSMAAETSLLTQKELADRLKISVRTVRNFTRRRQIPAIRIGNKLMRYRLEDVLEALQSRPRGFTQEVKVKLQDD